jgi:DNA (cytosine-5)-methyltransferase 1
MSISCVDLFCGAGGMSLGLKQSGLDVLVGVDSEDSCRFPYEHNLSPSEFKLRDVTQLSPDEVRGWYPENGWRVLVACPPCQPFSSYSNTSDTSGSPKKELVFEVLRITSSLMPEIVVMENVSGVLRDWRFSRFIEEMRNIGFLANYGACNLQDYGVPQSRQRALFIFSRVGEIKLPTKQRVRTVRDFIGHLPQLGQGCASGLDPLHRAASLSETNLMRIRASKPGGSWRDWPDKLILPCHRRPTGKTFSGVYGRMRWDEPGPTITTQFYSYGSGRFGHPEQDRALSLREGALLQGFPDNFKFFSDGENPSLRDVGRFIGNAVPVMVGRLLGDVIMSHRLKVKYE